MEKLFVISNKYKKSDTTMGEQLIQNVTQHNCLIFVWQKKYHILQKLLDSEIQAVMDWKGQKETGNV